MKTYNWGIIGTGSIAREMAAALTACRGTVYGVCGTSREKAERFAAENGVLHAFADGAALLADENVDIVYIATPHNMHFDYIRQAVLAGKHVLCEKAITVSSAELEEAAALAEEKGVVVMEAMTIFHMPLYKKLKEIVDSGAIGPVKMISVNFGSCKPYDVTSRFFRKELAGGALLDIGTYAVSFARYFLDERPDTVLSAVKRFETGVDEESGIVLMGENGQMAVIALSMRAKQPKRGVVAGELGYIEVSEYPRADRAAIVYTADGRREEITCGDSEKALEYEVEDMEKAVSEYLVSESMALSRDVMWLLSSVQKRWEEQELRTEQGGQKDVPVLHI